MLAFLSNCLFRSWDRGSLWETLLRCQLLFLPVTLLTLYVKYITVGLDWWLLEPERTLNAWAVLPFTGGDFLIGLILLPLAFALFFRVRPMPWSVAFLFPIVPLLVFLYIQLHAYYLLENFASGSLIAEGFRWGWKNIGLAVQYVPLASLAKLCLLLTLGALCSYGACSAAQRLRFLFSRRVQAAVFGMEVTVLVIVFALRDGRLPYTRPVLVRIASAMTSPSEAPMSPLDVLRERYRLLTGTPVAPAGDPYFGRASGSDLVLIVLETTPAQCLDLTGGDIPPALSNLRRRAWIGSQHHTTYPFTSTGLYSIATGMYPQEQIGRMGFFDQPSGLFSILRAHGYATAAYGTGMETFKRLLKAQRIGKLEEQACYTGAETIRYYNREWLHKQIASDERCLDLLLKDIRDWVSADRRFAVLYAPQVSHGPWQDLRGADTGRDPLERCRDLVSLQDQWIGRLSETLQRLGRLERTLIVVTADHGVRFREEDPRFRQGRIDSYSFQLPFLLYAPQALASPKVLEWVTSHIDIQPSVLGLLGIREGRELEQGLPVWDPSLAGRTTYFWAARVMGADGFHKGGRFYMLNHHRGTVYANSRMSFDEAQRVVDPAQAEDIKREIGQMDEIRRSWMGCAIEGCPGYTPPSQ